MATKGSGAQSSAGSSKDANAKASKTKKNVGAGSARQDGIKIEEYEKLGAETPQEKAQYGKNAKGVIEIADDPDVFGCRRIQGGYMAGNRYFSDRTLGGWKFSKKEADKHMTTVLQDRKSYRKNKHETRKQEVENGLRSSEVTGVQRRMHEWCVVWGHKKTLNYEYFEIADVKSEASILAAKAKAEKWSIAHYKKKRDDVLEFRKERNACAAAQAQENEASASAAAKKPSKKPAAAAKVKLEKLSPKLKPVAAKNIGASKKSGSAKNHGFTKRASRKNKVIVRRGVAFKRKNK